MAGTIQGRRDSRGDVGNRAGSPGGYAEKSEEEALYSGGWRLSRPCSGVKNQGKPNRPPLWEDEPSEEPRLRRARQTVPGSGRVLPGMPLQFADPDGDDAPPGHARFSRFDEPSRPWWRPVSKGGQMVLACAGLLVLGVLTTSALALRTYIDRDARFRIAGSEDIQATGLSEVSRANLLPVFGEDIGRNIFFVPLARRRMQLEKIPWIERATVMRLLPDQIRVAVVERQPVAFTRSGSEIGLVDAEGVLLPMSAAAMARHHYSFPVLTGIDRGDSPDGRRTRMAVYLRLMKELDSSGHRYSQQISEIDLTDPEDARVILPAQGRDILAHFGEDHFLERYQRYQAHIAEWRAQYANLAAVDLRYEQQVVLQMASGAETAQNPAVPVAKPDPAEVKQAQPKTKAVAKTHVQHAGRVSTGKKRAEQERARRLAARQAARRAERQRSSRTREAARAAAGVSNGG